MICVCRNIDRQKQSEAALGRQLRRQAALAELELAINEQHELQAALDRITQVVEEFLPAAAASIILWDDQSETFTLSASTLPGQPAQSGAQSVRREGGASREIIERRRPVVVNDVREDPQGTNPMLAGFGMQAYAGVPLLAEGRALGVLYAIDRAPRLYQAEDIDFLFSLASRAAAAIVKVRLYESLRQANTQLEHRVTERTAQLASLNKELIQREEHLRAHQEQLRAVSAQLLQSEEAERRRIAADIHDQVGQTLAACRIQMGILAAALDDDEREQAAAVRALMEQAIQETRSLTFDLSPPVLHELGLGPTLEWLAEDHFRRHGLRVLCETHGTPPPPGELSVLLFRVVRELLVNVSKHASAGQARVRLSADAAAIRIEVTDDGVGFESARGLEPRGRSGGFGLFSIRDRLRCIGGRLELEPAPGRGTRVLITAPLPEAPSLDAILLP